MKTAILFLLCAVTGFCATFGCATPSKPPTDAAPVGKSSVVLPLRTTDAPADPATDIECFTYKPEHWGGKRMILVHHGTLRNASEYRDDAIVLGDRFDALIVAPCFDKDRFPNLKYQRGGILRSDGTAAAPSEWTYAFVPLIAAAMRAREDQPHMKYWIIGHSAGGQFAMRMSAFQETGAERIVAANPGTDLFPTRDLEFGWGFGKLPDSLSNDAVLKRYLAAPLTLYLGTADDHPDEDLDVSETSMKQGAARLQRGRAAFALAQKVAAEHNWPLAWRLVEAPGIEHDHTKMFTHAACEDALFGSSR